MQKKRYISFNERIISRLEEFGFKRKNQGFFPRKISEDITQNLIFGHSTQGRAHVKYYAIRANIELPKVLKIAENLNVFLPMNAFCNSNIGDLMPKPIPTYLESLIGEDTDEQNNNSVLDTMLSQHEK